MMDKPTPCTTWNMNIAQMEYSQYEILRCCQSIRNLVDTVEFRAKRIPLEDDAKHAALVEEWEHVVKNAMTAIEHAANSEFCERGEHMITYKLLRRKNRKLYPLYVEPVRELPIGQWLLASVGEAADETHVRSKLGPLSLRPGFHSCLVPWTNWIGKKVGGILVQRKDTVWCECEVRGKHLTVEGGSKKLLNGWYFFRTNSKQKDPWIISRELKINRILPDAEVDRLCEEAGMVPQEREAA